MFNNMVTMQFIQAYRDYVQCSVTPIFDVLNKFSCDCGNPKAPAGTNCFPNSNYFVSSSQGFSGTQQRFTSPDADITVYSNSVSSSSDNVEYTIVKTEAPTASIASPSSFNEIIYKIATISGVKATNAFLGSDGHSVVGGGTVNLCIRRDPTATVPIGYSSISFATLVSGTITQSSNPITYQDEESICADVTADGTTYYIAYWGGTLPTPPPATTSPRRSFSPSITMSLLVLVFSILMN